jgi:hypothetical protein
MCVEVKLECFIVKYLEGTKLDITSENRYVFCNQIYLSFVCYGTAMMLLKSNLLPANVNKQAAQL